MDLRRLRVGEWIAAISGVVLIASLFMPWWKLSGRDGRSLEVSAWEALAVTDVLLFVLGVLGVAVLVLTARASAASPGVASASLVTPFALVMAVVCLLRVLNVPDELAPPPGVGAATDAAYGAWIGLAATWGVLVGVLVGMRDERLSKPGRLTDSTGVPVERPVEVEKLPAPPPA